MWVSFGIKDALDVLLLLYTTLLIIVSLVTLLRWFITRLVFVALISRGVLISRLSPYGAASHAISSYRISPARMPP